MSQADQFRIVLNPAQTKYKPGDTLSGKLIATFSSAQKCKGIRLRLTGKGEIRFSMKESSPPDDAETYWTLQTYLVGDGTSKIVLPSGTSEFDFAFILPHGLPSSYKSKYAKLTYRIDVVMKNKWAADKTAQALFNVESKVDLNTILVSSEPQSVNIDEDVGKLLFYCGRISLKLEIPKTGYVPGETLRIHGEVHNHTKRNIQEISLSIIQVHRFRVKSYVNKCVATAAKLTFPGVLAFGHTIIDEESINVPQLPPTDLGGCNIIGLEYKIRLEVKVKRIGGSICAEVPIFLGTVPLDSVGGRTEGEPPLYSDLDFPALPPPSPPHSALTTKHGASAPTLDSDDDDLPFPPPPYFAAYDDVNDGAGPSSVRCRHPGIYPDVYASAISLPSMHYKQ